MQGTCVTTVAGTIPPLVLLFSPDIVFVVIDISDTGVEDHAFDVPVELIINGELLFGRTLSAELEALRLIDSSLDDFNNSFSRSSSLSNDERNISFLIPLFISI